MGATEFVHAQLKTKFSHSAFSEELNVCLVSAFPSLPQKDEMIRQRRKLFQHGRETGENV